MKRSKWYLLAAGVAVVSLAAASLASALPEKQQLTKVTFQSKWVVQAQFAGYYAESRSADWRGAEFTADSRSHVSVYRLAA